MTTALEQLWSQVGGWSHPEYPFLDPRYSPGSLMPACDFTLWVRDRLVERDFDSVRELMAFISVGSEAWRRQLESFFTWRVPGCFEQLIEAELRATMLLCYRYAYLHGFRHLGFDWPRFWCVVLATQKRENEFDGRMAAVPPTTRLVVCDSAMRGVGNGLRLVPWSLSYGDRCYGNNTEWNRSFTDWLGCFELPSTAMPFPVTMVNRDELRNLTESCGIILLKRTKKAMMEEAATHEALQEALWREKGADLRVWAEALRDDALSWIKHMNEHLPEAQALVQEATLSFMRHVYPRCCDIRPWIEQASFEEKLRVLHDTHFRMAVNEAYVADGTSNSNVVFQFPAWELVRVGGSILPLGKTTSKGGVVDDQENDWPSRWVAAGGELFEGRMVALKDSPVWQALGDGAGGYEDTLGNPFPPFAFGSGYGIEQIRRAECLQLGVLRNEMQVIKPVSMTEAGLGEEVEIQEVTDETLEAWRAEKERRCSGGKRMTVAERLAALGRDADEFIRLSVDD